jgi:hypothetical protein
MSTWLELLLLEMEIIIKSKEGVQSKSKEFWRFERCKANLLSISQICDRDRMVQFSKKECNVFDEDGKWVMEE